MLPSMEFTKNEVLTVGQLAALLRVHPQTLSRMAKHRKIPAFKIGSAWRFTRSSIEEWLNSTRKRPRRLMVIPAARHSAR
jgi:excisionase family DNA binding protein